jgi:hypothetical protein
MGCYLLSGSLFAYLIFVLSWKGIVHVGLGWASRPGPLLLFGLFGLFFISIYKTRSFKKTLPALVLFIASIYLEYLPLGRFAWPIVGILFVLAAQATVYRNYGCLEKIIGFIIGGYIQTVFIYNIFAPEQTMTFFRGGWTA